MALQVGQQAPDFSLFDTEKRDIALSSFSGKNVLVLFFPLAFTSTCTEELCSVRDNLKMYEDLDVQPIGISVDSLFSLKKYKEEQNLNFPLLSDFNKEVSEAYGSLYENWGYRWKGVTKRSAFLIDKNGVIQYAEVLEDAGDLPNFEAIQGKIREMAK
jgi:glutaredoxin-dependent peroxiredoxin